MPEEVARVGRVAILTSTKPADCAATCWVRRSAGTEVFDAKLADLSPSGSLILIGQLKEIFIDAEPKLVEAALWVRKLFRREYQVQ